MTTKINRLLGTALLITSFISGISAQTNATAQQLTAMHQTMPTSFSMANEPATEVLVPENLQQNFNRIFESATSVKWVLSGDRYIGNFTLADKKHMVVFNKKGEFLFAKIHCTQGDLCKPVQQQLQNGFSSFAVYDVIEIKTPETINYQVILQNEKRYADLRFTQDGELVSTKLTDRLDR